MGVEEQRLVEAGVARSRVCGRWLGSECSRWGWLEQTAALEAPEQGCAEEFVVRQGGLVSRAEREVNQRRMR